MAALAILALITAVVLRIRYRARYLLAGWALFLVTLIPVIGIIQRLAETVGANDLRAPSGQLRQCLATGGDEHVGTLVGHDTAGEQDESARVVAAREFCQIDAVGLHCHGTCHRLQAIQKPVSQIPGRRPSPAPGAAAERPARQGLRRTHRLGVVVQQQRDRHRGSRRASRSAISGRLCTSISAGDIRRSTWLAACAKRKLTLPGQSRFGRTGGTPCRETPGRVADRRRSPSGSPVWRHAGGQANRSPRHGAVRTLRAGAGPQRPAVRPRTQATATPVSRHSDDIPASFVMSTPYPPSGTLPYGGPPRSCRAHRAAGRHRAGRAPDPGAGAWRLDGAQLLMIAAFAGAAPWTGLCRPMD